MQRFVDDDAGFQSWIARYPDGYVLNTNRKPSPSYLILHRATCRTIAGDPISGSRWTGEYIKVCGDRAELERWARAEVGAAPKPCVHCE